MNQHTRCKTLMVQGCTSDAGKTVLVAALCRILARRGVKVAPFKPQNMALNSAVTADGGEIGRAQALQALAAGIPPQIDFNPILLKPSSDKQAQVIIHGHAAFNLDAKSYHEYKPRAMQAVLESWQRLQANFDCIVVEGAGSPAEINLRERDIANMGFAETVDCPVILIGDIDRGGVFAHLTGTLNLLSPSEQARIKGFVINRFRGDIGLLQSGLDWLEAHTQKPVLGVVPYLMGLFLDAEDALAKEQTTKPAAQIQVIVPATPRISNHNDFDPLRLHPQINFRFIGPGETIPASDLIILPGSKNVRADLAWLKAAGWHEHLQRHLRYGGKVIGICGGLQMLGQAIHDPEGRESTPGSETGFACLDLETTLHAEKKLENVHGFLALPGSPSLSGYEIHQGISQGPALAHPALWLSQNDAGEKQRPDGALSNDGKILATYCHGLFDQPEALLALLQWSGMNAVKTVDFAARREADIERLADAVEGVLDWKILAPYL